MRIIALATLFMAMSGRLTPRHVAPESGPPGKAVPGIQSQAHGDDSLREAIASQPPAPWANADPADSLYRAARAALANGDYHRAAELFRRISDSYPQSTYVATARYYEAFALYRGGETSDLHRALEVLRATGGDGPSGRRGDAAALHTRICSALAQQGDESCTVHIVQQAESASVRCPPENDESDVRIAALDGLMQMDAERAMPILDKVLERRDACSVGLRRKALFLVSQRDPPASTDLLLRSARHDTDPEVRAQAVFWLSQIHDPRVVEMLDSVATHEGEENVREKAVFALSQQDNAKSAAALRSLAMREDLEPNLREKAVFWLGQSHTDESTTFLKELFARATSESLKEKILFSLSQQGGTTDWILGIAVDDHQPASVRGKAVFWASQGGVGVDRLVALYGRIGDSQIREQVLFAISQRHETGATDALITIAKTEKDPELRKRAVFWLGQSSDRRAAQYLQELIAQ